MRNIAFTTPPKLHLGQWEKPVYIEWLFKSGKGDFVVLCDAL